MHLTTDGAESTPPAKMSARTPAPRPHCSVLSLYDLFWAHERKHSQPNPEYFSEVTTHGTLGLILGVVVKTETYIAMIPGHSTQNQGASNFSEGFPPFFAFPRGAPGMSWSDNAGSESNGQAACTFAPQSTLLGPLPPFGFDFMAMQAMMAQMTLNPSPVEAAASIPQTAGFAQTWSAHPQAVAQLGSSAHQQAQVNPSNVCSTLRNILMNFARRNAPGGQGKPKASMKRVPTSDAAFLSVGWTLDANPEIILELAKDPVGSRYEQFR